jgi:6-phosphogluconolactonase
MTDGMAAGGGPVVRVLPDPASAAAAAAEAIADALGDAIAERGRADWATTGGSVAVPIYKALTSERLRGTVVWPAVHLWWGDDRYVPYDHPLSNVFPAAEILLALGHSHLGRSSGNRMSSSADEPEALDIPTEQVHRFPTTEAIDDRRGPEWCAERYAVELRAAGPAPDGDGRPVLDLVVLGVGPDGHVLSVFPDSTVWDVDDLAAAVPAPTHVEPHVPRVTLHPSLVASARQVIVVSTGEGKAEAIGRAWSPGSEREVPARIAMRPGATWLLDRAAAARLRA